MEENGYAYAKFPPITAVTRRVSARREELPGLLKPQNDVARVVFVSTASGWTASLAPNCPSMHGDVELRSDVRRLSRWLLQDKGIRPSVEGPGVVDALYIPPVSPQEAIEPHYATLGACTVRLDYFPEQLAVHHGSTPSLWRGFRPAAGGKEYSFFNEHHGGLLEQFGLTEFPYKYSERLLVDDHQAVADLWDEWGPSQLESVLQQVGIEAFDDAFYGTEGFLAEIWPPNVEPFEV